jgi:prepilin-type N-terminal cleavage/methylation domain-containing protein
MSARVEHKGFTLVELMVVVIIVLVLAGIAVPVYVHYLQQGKKSEAYAVIDGVRNGAFMYFQRNGTFAGGTLTRFRAADEVANARYFTYALSSLTATGYTCTATLRGTWGRAGARVVYTHSSANSSTGKGGRGAYSESGW